MTASILSALPQRGGNSSPDATSSSCSNDIASSTKQLLAATPNHEDFDLQSKYVPSKADLEAAVAAITAAEIAATHSPAEPSKPQHVTGGGMSRSQTLQSLSASSTSSSNDSSTLLMQQSHCHNDSTNQSTSQASQNESVYTIQSVTSLASSIRSDFATFGMDLHRYTNASPETPVFDRGMRHILEPHMRKARLMREKARNRSALALSRNEHHSIASMVGVPYPSLRLERPFLYDTFTHPLHEVLAETLGVKDLSQLHTAIAGLEGGRRDDDALQHLMEPLKTRMGRRKFQESYDIFVTSFCIPLLHSLAMKDNLVHSGNGNTSAINLQSLFSSSSTRVHYRYQAFPSLRVMRPGDASEGPSCDTALGYNVGYLRFHVPLTPSFGTNALYTESYPGKEDWHPLATKSTGLGFVFDGARCIHYHMENTTDSTLVALDFVVAIYSDDHSDNKTDGIIATGGDELCHRRTLEDQFSLSGPGFYEEAVIDVGMGRHSPMWHIVAKKHDGRSGRLLDPDERVGFPFA